MTTLARPGRPEASGPSAATAPRRAQAWLPAPDERFSVAVDLVAAVAATMVAALGYRTSFGGTLWLRVGFPAALLAMIIGHLAATLRWSALTTFLAGTAGIFLGAGIAAPGTAILGFLPGPGTPGAVVDGLTHGWARLLTTVTPVGTADNMPVIVYATAFLATLASVLLARRTAFTWAVTLPALALLIVTILVGTESPAALVLQGAGLGVLTLVWTAHRARRDRQQARVVGDSRSHDRLAALAFLALVSLGAVALAPSLPFTADQPRYVLRRHTEPPFDPRSYPSVLTQYKHWRNLAKPTDGRKADRRAVLVAHGLPKNVPLRLAALDIYDGSVWAMGSPTKDGDVTGSGRFQRVGSDLRSGEGRLAGQTGSTPDATGDRARVTVENIRLEGPWVPVTAGLDGVEFTGPNATALESALRFNTATGTVAVTRGFAPGDTVTFTAEIPEVSHALGAGRAQLVGSRRIDPAVVLGSIDDPSNSISARANNLANGRGAYEKAAAIEKALTAKGTAYFSDSKSSTGQVFPAGHTAGQLQRFLAQTANGRPIYIGNAEKFAAAMAAMARTLDLPARVVVGFRENANDKRSAKRDGDTVTFTADQYDAWVEIAFEDVGWVSFFPTPPRSNGDPPPPQSREPTSRQVELQSRPPTPPPPNLENLATRRNKGQKVKKPVAEKPPFLSLPTWLLPTIGAISLPLLALALVIGAILWFKQARRTRRRTSGSPVDRLVGAWREAIDQLRDAGIRPGAAAGPTRPQAMTRRQIAASIPGGAWPTSDLFARRMDAALLGPQDPTAETAEALWADVDGLRAALVEDRTRGQRWKVRLNPTTLRPWR